MRMIPTLAIGFGALLVLTACGTNDQRQEQAGEQAPNLTSDEKIELEQEFTNLPPAAIVRVPVDADGNVIGEPEMRVLHEGEAPTSEQAMSTAWTNAKAPEAMVSSESELDADSSTQSWSSWGGGNCHYIPRSRCGFGQSFNQNFFGNVYRPQLYTRGYRWNYNRGFNCRRGNYNYFSYRPNRHW